MDISGEQLTKVFTTLDGKDIIFNGEELQWCQALAHVLNFDRTSLDPVAAYEIAHTLMHAAEGEATEGVTLTDAQVKIAKALTLADKQFTNIVKAQILKPLG